MPPYPVGKWVKADDYVPVHVSYKSLLTTVALQGYLNLFYVFTDLRSALAYVRKSCYYKSVRIYKVVCREIEATGTQDSLHVGICRKIKIIGEPINL